MTGALNPLPPQKVLRTAHFLSGAGAAQHARGVKMLSTLSKKHKNEARQLAALFRKRREATASGSWA